MKSPVVYYGFASAAPAVLSFAALAIFTRLLTPSEYGVYATAITVVAVANAILFQWLRSGVRRYAPAGGHSEPRFLATTRGVFLRLAAGVVLLAILLSLSLPLSLVILGALVLIAQAWYELGLELVLSTLNPVRYGVLATLRAVLWVVASTVLIRAGYGAIGVLAGLLLGYVASGALMLGREWILAKGGGVDAELADRFRTYGVPLTAAFLLQLIVYSSDRLLLARLASSSAVGVYSASYDLAMQPLTFLMMTVNLAAFPLAARTLDKVGAPEARKHLAVQSALHATLAVPAAVGLSLLAPSIAIVVLGAEFRDIAVRLIPWVALGGLISGLKSYYFDLAFQLGKSTSRQLLPVGAAAAANVGFNIWLIPTYGPMGAAYSTVVAFAVGLVLSIAMGHQRFPMPVPFDQWARVAAASGAMAAVVLLVGQAADVRGLVLRVLTGIVTFAFFAVLLNVLGSRTTLFGRTGVAT